MHNDPTLHAMLENNRKKDKTTGDRFENLMLQHLKAFAKNENVYRKNAGEEFIHVLPYSKAEDEYHGTDIMFRDKSGFFGRNGYIRMDITHNFSEKDNMPFVANMSNDEKLIIEGHDNHRWEFKYGIRVGNLNENFRSPVIVIGFDMLPSEYERFEDDMKAQRNLASSIYEIVNMSNDMQKSFFYQVDAKFRRETDAEFDEDERPDPELITFNKEYLTEAGKYVPKRWTLPEDTSLAKASRKLLHDMVYSPVLEKLNQKYEAQGLSDSVTKMDNGPKGPEK